MSCEFHISAYALAGCCTSSAPILKFSNYNFAATYDAVDRQQDDVNPGGSTDSLSILLSLMEYFNY